MDDKHNVSHEIGQQVHEIIDLIYAIENQLDQGVTTGSDKAIDPWDTVCKIYDVNEGKGGGKDGNGDKADDDNECEWGLVAS